MKVGIVVPYSYSFWGGVQEHADHQARALIRLGVDARIIMGHDPPGRLTWLLHPKQGRHNRPPDYVMPVGRSVIVPANASLPNIILSPPAMLRMRRIWAEERFDVVHVHEPLAPVLSAFALAHRAVPARGHLPLGRRPAGLVSAREGVLGRPRDPHRPADRRLGVRPARRRAVHRRADRGDPERHRPPSRGRSGRAQRRHRLHRQERAAERPAGPPPGVAADSGEHGGTAAARRGRPALRALARAPAGLLARRASTSWAPSTRRSSPPSSRPPPCSWRRPSAARASGWC